MEYTCSAKYHPNKNNKNNHPNKNNKNKNNNHPNKNNKNNHPNKNNKNNLNVVKGEKLNTKLMITKMD